MAEIAGSESPKRRETDLGADHVRSKPATRLASSTRPAVRISPSGEMPARTWRRSSGSTAPSSPSRRAPSPTQYPGDSPEPV